MDSLSPWGELSPVPRYHTLERWVSAGPGRESFKAISTALNDLSRAVQLGHHRPFIEELSSKLDQLGPDSLKHIAAAALEHVELCTALSVYLTCLEQTYHWPGEVKLTTPIPLHDYKIVIQVFHEPELRAMLDDFLFIDETFASNAQQRPFSQNQMTLAALAMGKGLFEEATVAYAAGTWPLPRPKQDRVNLLNRTARGDIWDQGNSASRDCHKEMGRLHEMVHTNGTQRRCQEIFEDAGGVSRLQCMPALLTHLDHSPASSLHMGEALAELQIAVARVNEELFNMVVDEVIWGHTFTKWSKACGVGDVGSSGSDCPLFWMLDGFIGRADPKGKATLPDSLAYRSRFFPPDVSALVKGLASAPALRAHVAKAEARYGLVQAWKGFQQILHDMYDIHRKKAMRVILALRAGRSTTSTGIQEAASPEAHLSATLYQGISIRFGPDIRDLNIDAYAWSSPLLFGPNGCIEAARARFVFSTPLVVSPGSTVSVTVPLPAPAGHEPLPERMQWLERTYSITFIHALQWAGKAASGSCQLAGSVEVCVRNQGRVSAHICNQQAGFPIRLRIQSTPHFCIQGNAAPRDETIFVAQGGAVGVFLGWLARQKTLVGQYRLVVGARDYSMLAYSNFMLCQPGDRFGSALRIVVSLSRPGLGDVPTLLSAGVQPYTGRTTGYLSRCSLSGHGKTTWYVCGSARFGLDVARCIEARPKMHAEAQSDFFGRLGARLHPILTSELPSVRLHVSGSSTTTGESTIEVLRAIPRIELALHNQPGDRWIALGDRVFDISILATFHPGGEKVLAHCSGRDAQGMLDTVHRGSHMVESMLDQMLIGRLAPSTQSEWEDVVAGLVEVQNDLETQSRFEQTPTGCPMQLERAPPAEVIRGSLEGLAKGWADKVLSGKDAYHGAAARLESALQEVNVYLDGVQARAYTEHFADVAKCAAALRHVYNCHYTAISKIHDMIDDMKRETYECVEILKVSLDQSFLTKGTEEIIKAIRDMMTEDTTLSK